LPGDDSRKRGFIANNASLFVINADFRDEGSQIGLFGLKVTIVYFIAHQVIECRDALGCKSGADTQLFRNPIKTGLSLSLSQIPFVFLVP
jgi:hypothetical protein